LSINLNLQSSDKEGLKKYNAGIAKEGVGAGGAAIAATLKSVKSHDSTSLLHSIEKEYEKTIEKQKKHAKIS
jgi:NaMN:DMB phosphoribosyltransferase